MINIYVVKEKINSIKYVVCSKNYSYNVRKTGKHIEARQKVV